MINTSWKNTKGIDFRKTICKKQNLRFEQAFDILSVITVDGIMEREGEYEGKTTAETGEEKIGDLQRRPHRSVW
jgi:hypothetical protein